MIPTIPAITSATVKLVINSLLVPEDFEGEGLETESRTHTSPSRIVPGPQRWSKTHTSPSRIVPGPH